MTFAGLAGVGDLIATCMSPLSRNHSFGVRLGQGMAVSEVVAVTKQTAEGVKSCTSILDLARNNGVDVPIIEQVDAMIQHDRTAQEVVAALLSRPRKAETRRCTAARRLAVLSGRRRRGPGDRSRQRSSTSSMPTESRIRFSGTLPARSGMRRRRSSWLSTPPRLVECTQTRVAAQTRSAASAPPATSIDDDAAPNPGWRTRSTAGCAAQPRGELERRWPGPARPAGAGCAARAAPARPPSARRSRRAGCGAVEQPLVVGATGIRRGGDHGAEEDVAVAGEVLGHRVHDDVGAELERPLEQGGGEGVVDDGRARRARGPRPSSVGRSATSSSGLVGDSSQSRSAPSRAASTASVSATSTRRTDGRPLGLAVGEGGERAVVGGVGRDDGAAVGERATAPPATAAIPEASTSASPPSRSPSAASKADHVGLPERA